MDIFNTVVSAIDLAQRVRKLIDDHRKAPERLRALQFEIKSLQSILERVKATKSLDTDPLLQGEIVEIESILQRLLAGILKLGRNKISEGILSRHMRNFRIQKGYGDLDELTRELQKRKTSLNLGMVVNIGANMQPGPAPTSPITVREFLNLLDAPNYVDDHLRIKEPSNGTASWIYDRTEYKDWQERRPISSLHLVGKMGSGKSVLMKSIVQNFRTLHPTPHRSAVLYYFCTCVNRADTPISILKGLIAQLVIDCDGLFEKAIPDLEVLRIQRSPDKSSWSFESLWEIFTTLIRHTTFSQVYCAIDALDECDPTGLDGLLANLLNLGTNASLQGIEVKLLFSSRAQPQILSSLEAGEASFRIFVQPDIVAPDIRVAMQHDLLRLKRLLNLDEEEIQSLQEALLAKSDGMFLWVSLAMKELMTNCYGATYEGLEGLIKDLPSGLKGLYEKSWVKLVQSLPPEQFSLAKRILIWLLLARRALTVQELTLALAVKPGERHVPSSKRLLRTLSGFVLTYLTPFVEVSGEDTSQKSPEILEDQDPTIFVPVGPRVRLVHHSVQDYLLSVCREDNAGPSTSHLSINLRDGHEEIARVCISYLRCEELQLGWIDLENRDPDGMQIMTKETKIEVRKRSEAFPLLQYAAEYWPYHVRQCQFVAGSQEIIGYENQRPDIFQDALDLFRAYSAGYACAAQVRQLKINRDHDTYFGPGHPLSCAVAWDISVLVRRMLTDPTTNIHERDDADQSSPLHFAATADISLIRPEERREIIEVLLEHGAEINCVDLIGNTPLHRASSFPLPEVVKILLEKGADISVRNTRGETPLNQTKALWWPDVVDILIRARADTETTDTDGYSPIIKAARSNEWETVRMLLQSGADPRSSCPEGLTCLHFATEYGNIDMMKLLLDANVPIDIQTNIGFSPLHYAASNDQFEAASFLLERGANFSIANIEDTLPLHLAAEFASPKLLRLLLQSDTNVEVPGYQGNHPLFFALVGKYPRNASVLLQRGANIETRDENNATLLHTVAGLGLRESAEILLDHGADVNAMDDYGETALHSAARKGALDVVKLLVERGALVNGSSNVGEYKPLACAAAYGHVEIVSYLLQQGAVVDYPSSSGGLTALMWSCKEGRLETSKLLLANGADVNARGKGFDALCLACIRDQVEIVKWLIDNGADATQMRIQYLLESEKEEPGHPDIVSILLDNGVLADEMDENGDAVLHKCIIWERLNIARALLQRGANVNALDSLGRTPLAIALSHGKKGFVTMLLEHGPDPNYSIDPMQSAVAIAAQTGDIDFLRQLQDVHFTEEVLQAAANNPGNGVAVVEFLLDRQKEIPITADVLISAALNGGLGKEIISLLLERRREQIQVSPFLLRAGAGNPREKTLLEFLLEILASHMQSNASTTPLIAACWAGDLDKVTLLLAKEANVNEGNVSGWTPLHMAAWNGHSQIVQLLLDNGADATVASSSGWMPYDLAHANAHIQLARLLAHRSPDTAFPSTTEFHSITKSSILELVAERQEVIYVGGQWTYPITGSVLGNFHISPLVDVFYFEIEVLDAGETGEIGVGVCREGCSLLCMPGWQDISWGYHGDNGKKYHNSGMGQSYGETFGTGDVVGCRLDVLRGDLEFRKNGKSMGVAFPNVAGRLFPVVGLSSDGAHVRATFMAPFKYPVN